MLMESAEIKGIPPEKLHPWSFGSSPAMRDWLVAEQGKT